MRSGWPHTQADHGRPSGDQRRGPFGPDVSWPTGYSGLEYRDGDYRYHAPRAPQPPATHGQHPYAAFSAAGYGDDGYQDPGYEGPAAQDAGYYPAANGYGQAGYAGSGYGGAGQAERAYPARAAHEQGGYEHSGPYATRPQAPDPRWQAWDYGQPLRYEDDEPAQEAEDGYGQLDAYRQPGGFGGEDDYQNPGGYGPGAYHAAPAYDPADYNGSAHSRPGIDGPGYDLSGIIGTGDFEQFGYGEPDYDRLSYDDPRYDGQGDGGPGYGQARYGDPGDGGFGYGEPPGGPGSGPVSDETRLDLAGFGGTRFDETRFDMPRFDETRLDSLWLADEDAQDHVAVGYENDGFGGDGWIRSEYSYSGSPDETRLDLGGDPRMDQTRFDVPAFDETRIDSMRALEPRPAATGLLAPPDNRQIGWSGETLLDDFGDPGALAEEPVRAPAAFTRTAERPDDTGTRRAVGRRRGRSGDRRQWMALGAIAVVAAGAIGGVLMKYVFSGPSGPAHTVVAPHTVDGFTRQPNLEKQMKVGSLAASIAKDSSGHVSGLVPAVYEQGSAVSGANTQVFMFVGGKLSGASPSASVASFEQAYPGTQVVPAGPMGGEAVCAERQLNGEGVAMCVWFDNDSFGALVSPTMSTTKLASTLDEVRPGLELYAK